ncbi:tetratricopeptide repeat protein [Stieleria marina]|uniref:tetratricopeptide repeat protein n=1 Tax=Stieleria marina TaxID=1930275 RepID=UPI003AF3C360
MSPSEKQSDSNAPAALNIERRQELEVHLRTSPTDLDGFLELGAIYRAEDRPAEARRILEQARKIFPDDMKVLWEFEEATLARSLQQLREVADLDQRLCTSETERELQRSQTDWASRRIEVCKARLKRNPSLVHLRIVLAEALYDAEMYEKSLNAVKPLLSSDEHSPYGYLIGGRCLLELKRDVEAMAAFRAASLRRSVISPPRTKVAALKLLCETAERLGVELTQNRYREALQIAEQQLAAATP